jgi:hypothetical protein
VFEVALEKVLPVFQEKRRFLKKASALTLTEFFSGRIPLEEAKGFVEFDRGDSVRPPQANGSPIF